MVSSRANFVLFFQQESFVLPDVAVVGACGCVGACIHACASTCMCVFILLNPTCARHRSVYHYHEISKLSKTMARFACFPILSRPEEKGTSVFPKDRALKGREGKFQAYHRADKKTKAYRETFWTNIIKTKPQVYWWWLSCCDAVSTWWMRVSSVCQVKDLKIVNCAG